MSDPTTWTEALPEDVRGWDEVKNSDSSAKFWNQMTNMRSRMGASIRIPSAEAGDDDRNEFYTKLQEKVPGLMRTPDFEKEETLSDLYSRMGRPKEAKDYKVPEFKNSKGEKVEGVGKEFAESFKEVAFKAGMSQKKYEEALSAMVGRHLQTTENAQRLHKEDRDKLSAAWGQAYDRNSTIVSNFLSQTGAPESVLNAVKAGSADSTTMQWLHSLATKTIGKPADFQGDASNRSVMTPAEATIKISEIRNNPKHPYNLRHDPGHAAAKEYMRELYLLKNPESGKQSAPGTVFNIGGNT